MEYRLVLICLVVILGGSYAYSYGRRGYGHDVHGDYYHSPHRGYYNDHGYGYGYHPRREAYIRGAIYDHGDSSSEDDHEDDDDHHERSWRFQIGDDYGAYEYLDSDGHVKGFLPDLLRAVCEKAEKKCFYIVDTNSHCWDTDGERELPGVGLLDHYYDGCLGLWQTNTRLNSFNFTLPFTPDVYAALFRKAGEKVESPKTVTGLKIGFVEGWASSKKCFERQQGFVGNSPGKYTPVLFETSHDMIAAITAGEIDALVSESTINNDKKLPIESTDTFKCTVAGSSLMAHYGSEAIDWWNDAFLHMKEDGSFESLCETSATTHAEHGHINCI